MKYQPYEDFANYYDWLGWNRFARICAERLEQFIRFRGTGNEAILDLACGTGELEYCLRNTALKFTGVDLSSPMLKQAKKKNRKIKFHQGDFCEIRLQEKYDIVVCFFDSVNHLSGITKLRKLFKTASIHLKPGGHFIFDMLTPEGLERWESVEVRRDDDYLVLVNGHFDSDKIAAEVNIEGFVRSGKNSYKRFNQQVYERSFAIEEVAEALTLAGFDDIAVSAFNCEEPVEQTSRWFFVTS